MKTNALLWLTIWSISKLEVFPTFFLLKNEYTTWKYWKTFEFQMFFSDENRWSLFWGMCLSMVPDKCLSMCMGTYSGVYTRMGLAGTCLLGTVLGHSLGNLVCGGLVIGTACANGMCTTAMSSEQLANTQSMQPTRAYFQSLSIQVEYMVRFRCGPKIGCKRS